MLRRARREGKGSLPDLDPVARVRVSKVKIQVKVKVSLTVKREVVVVVVAAVVMVAIMVEVVGSVAVQQEDEGQDGGVNRDDIPFLFSQDFSSHPFFRQFRP